MPVESGDYIDDLSITNPPDSEAKKFGAGYLRFIKKVLTQTFPNFTGAMTATHDELSWLADIFAPASATVANAAGVLNLGKNSDIASASSINLATMTGNFAIVTGTTTITALGTVQAGARRLLQTASALTFTHNGTSLILPDGYDIRSVANEVFEFLSLGSGNWMLIRNGRPSVGEVKYWPTGTAPSGWLARDGSAISRTTYSGLFKLLVTDQGFSGQTFTVTIATPGVFTKATHGFSGGERIRLSTTGSLPTGLDTSTDYYVTIIDTDTFKVSTTRANYMAGTFVATTGSQSGTHTFTQSLYGLGDGSTTFNLPDDQDLFIRGRASSGRTIGSEQPDTMQGHQHTTSMDGAYTHGMQTRNSLGADEGIAKVNNGAGAASNPFYVRDPTTDGTNGTARTSSETRARNRAYLPIIKY